MQSGYAKKGIKYKYDMSCNSRSDNFLMHRKYESLVYIIV